MTAQINYKNLAAEFVVIVAGVVLALAADSWREELRQKRLEQDYLGRLETEIAGGRRNLEFQLQRFSSALASANFLVDQLTGNSEASSDALLVEHFTRATRTGSTAASVVSDSVYSELVSTGRLSLISDVELRVALADYHRSVEQLSGNLITLPLWKRFREMTGKEAGSYLAAGESPQGEIAVRLVGD